MLGFSNGHKPNWSPANVFDNYKSLLPIATLSAGTHILELLDSIGSCEASDQVIIVIRSPIRIPTAISPNGDGSNDIWIVSGLENYSKFLVLVYNRYGIEVHKQQNSFDPWNGDRNG